MARKPKPLAPAERQSSALERLRAAGGRRISINLPATIAQAVDKQMKRSKGSQTEVILWCIRSGLNLP